MDIQEASSILTPQSVTAELLKRGLDCGTINTIHVAESYESSVASVFKIDISYLEESCESKAPRSAFVKIYQLDKIESHSSTEIKFFEEIAPSLNNFITPKLFGVLKSTGNNVVLLIEDLNCGYTNKIDILEEHLENLTKTLGEFHSNCWNSSVLLDDTFKNLRDVETRMHFASGNAICENKVFITSRIQEFINNNSLDLSKDEVALLKSLSQVWGNIFQKRIEKSDLTLIHGDFHLLGNIFYSKDFNQFKVIDWADAKIGLGVHDLAYSLLPVEAQDRVKRDTELLKIYLNSLYTNGVQGYDWESLLFDYRLSLLNNLLQSVSQQSLRWFRKTAKVAQVWNAKSLLAI